MRFRSLHALALILSLGFHTPAFSQHADEEPDDAGAIRTSSNASALEGSSVRASTAPPNADAMQRLEAIREDTLAPLENALPLSLEDALEISLSDSPTLAIQEAETRIARTRAESTRSAYRPTIGISAGIELNTGSGYVAGSSQLSDTQGRTTATSLNASINASQLIYDFGSFQARRRGAEASIRSTLAAEAQHRQDLRNDVIQNYLRAGAAREKLAVAFAVQDAERKRAKQIDAFVEVGERPGIDRATARANVANATARIIDAATAYDLIVYDLLRTMGIDETRDLNIQWIDLETQALENLDVQELRQQGVEQRGEFQSLQAELEAAEEAIKESNTQFLPTLNAVAGVSESLLIGRNGRWNAYIGARLNWDIYRGSQVQFQKREQEAQRDRLALEHHKLLVDLVQQIQRAQREIQGAKTLLETREIVVENATKQLELAEGRYEQGLGNIVELSDAQLAFTEAQYDLIDAALKLSLARSDLISAVAGWQ